MDGQIKSAALFQWVELLRKSDEDVFLCPHLTSAKLSVGI